MVQESFLEYQKAEHLDAASLTEKLISCLEKYGLEYKENLVGQGYDGAAVMGSKQGLRKLPNMHFMFTAGHTVRILSLWTV